MTRKDFVLIAATIASLDLSGYDAAADTVRADIARQFADRLVGTNANFDRTRFLTACHKSA